MNTRQKAFELIDAERNRQDAKWGEQNHPPQFWTGILGEEFGEYCQAVNETVFDNGPSERLKGGYENMMRELVHVAAVAVGAMECLMREKMRQKCELTLEAGPRCRTCRYRAMTREEVKKLGFDPCIGCDCIKNWEPKEEKESHEN